MALNADIVLWGPSAQGPPIGRSCTMDPTIPLGRARDHRLARQDYLAGPRCGAGQGAGVQEPTRGHLTRNLPGEPF